MIKFVLLTVLHLNSGIDQTDVADYDMSGEDCIAALVKMDSHPAADTEYMCEIQHDAPIDAE